MNYNKRKICILKNQKVLLNFTAVKIEEKVQYKKYKFLNMRKSWAGNKKTLSTSTQNF